MANATPLLITDPVDLALDPVTNDLVVPMRHTTGAEAVRQGVRIRLLTFKGEVFMDLDAGVPYLEGDGIDEDTVILGGAFDADVAELAFRKEILAAPGVATLDKLALSFDGATRELRIDWRATTTFGDTISDVTETDILGQVFQPGVD